MAFNVLILVNCVKQYQPAGVGAGASASSSSASASQHLLRAQVVRHFSQHFTDNLKRVTSFSQVSLQSFIRVHPHSSVTHLSRKRVTSFVQVTFSRASLLTIRHLVTGARLHPQSVADATDVAKNATNNAKGITIRNIFEVSQKL